MADVIILTKIAQQVAMSKENCAGAALPNQWRFLAKMWIKARYPGSPSGFTDPDLPVKPIDMTLSRTERTILQQRVCDPDFLFQQSLPMCCYISWRKHMS